MSLSYTIAIFCLGVQFTSFIFIIAVLYYGLKNNVNNKYCYLTRISKDGRCTTEKVKMKELSDYIVKNSKNNSFYITYEMEK